jgi:hypothetical protein
MIGASADTHRSEARVRHTPFLDAKGITFKETVPDSITTILDSALHAIENLIDWGEYEGKKRLPCPEQSVMLAGAPLGQYHCPFCGMMILAGMPHFEPGATPEQKTHPQYPLDDYEVEYGRPWPPGYVS